VSDPSFDRRLSVDLTIRAVIVSILSGIDQNGLKIIYRGKS